MFLQGTKDVEIGSPVAIMVEEESDLAAASSYVPGSKGM